MFSVLKGSLLLSIVLATACAAPGERPRNATDTALSEGAKAGCSRYANDRNRLDSMDRGCLRRSGRTYDLEDLQGTGATTVGEAIRRLDPSFR